MIDKIEQITEEMIDEDCLALVIYVDTKGMSMSMSMADKYLDQIRDDALKFFYDKDVKILVVPNTIRIEVLRKTKEEKLKVIKDEPEYLDGDLRKFKY